MTFNDYLEILQQEALDKKNSQTYQRIEKGRKIRKIAKSFNLANWMTQHMAKRHAKENLNKV